MDAFQGGVSYNQPEQSPLQGVNNFYQSPFGLHQNLLQQMNGYKTPLNMFQEKNYQDWVKKNKIPARDDWREGYDMRGFYQDPNAQTSINPIDHQIHFTDQHKQPWHHTFSQESGNYLGNPFGAGQWGGQGRNENYYQAGLNGFVPSGIQP